ncbi:MAG: glycosyltransferase, partial [Verrucomicrobiota bacterium]|nr:glycosyltransferase [Verrucomicrobiota bacterium]
MLSFIVPAYNEARELPSALAALRAAAEGAGAPYEVIVVDDDSNDATAEIARRAGARVAHVHLRQIAAVRNAGARLAQGDTLFFVDADT